MHSDRRAVVAGDLNGKQSGNSSSTSTASSTSASSSSRAAKPARACATAASRSSAAAAAADSTEEEDEDDIESDSVNGTMMCDVHHLADVPLEVCALAIDLALPVGLQMARLAADDVDEAVAAHLAHKASTRNLRKCTYHKALSVRLLKMLSLCTAEYSQQR
jgi:hypothetical protein